MSQALLAVQNKHPRIFKCKMEPEENKEVFRRRTRGLFLKWHRTYKTPDTLCAFLQKYHRWPIRMSQTTPLRRDSPLWGVLEWRSQATWGTVKSVFLGHNGRGKAGWLHRKRGSFLEWESKLSEIHGLQWRAAFSSQVGGSAALRASKPHAPAPVVRGSTEGGRCDPRDHVQRVHHSPGLELQVPRALGPAMGIHSQRALEVHVLLAWRAELPCRTHGQEVLR